MARTSALPADLGADEMNEMIRELARELGCPSWAHPDLVEIDHIPPRAYGLNSRCPRTGLDEYREGQQWRRRAIAELQHRPDWIAEWRAARDLDRRIEDLCERKGMRFAPYETTPWQVGDSPEPERADGTFATHTRPAARELRRRLIREIAVEDQRR
jgi:anaerobic selenocysteine-containing dehydrogenase